MNARVKMLVPLAAAVVAAAAFATVGVETIDRYYRIDARVSVGGQPTPEQVEALSEAGFNGIINLREESEFNDGPQSFAARNSGIRFVRSPISRSDPEDAAVDRFLEVTDQETLYPVFIYCATANRAVALWMVRRVLREGWTLEKALDEAERAGLRNGTMREFAVDYVRRHAGKEAAS